MNKERGYLLMELLKIAESDLHMSGLLYQKGFYAGAVYHLQQCVEKTAKVEALFNNKIQEGELKKKIGHSSFRIDALNTINIFKKLPKYNENDKELKWFKHLISGKPDKALLVLSFIPKEKILHLLNVRPNSSKKLFLRSEDIFNRKINKKGKVIDLSYELFVMSLIFSPHAEISRYPNKLLSPLQYNKNLGIVQAFYGLGKRMSKIWVLLKFMVLKKYPKLRHFDKGDPNVLEFMKNLSEEKK